MEAPLGIQLNRLKPGDIIKSRFALAPARIGNWKYASECDQSITSMAHAMFEVMEVDVLTSTVKIKAFGSSPPRVLKLAGGELGSNFYK